LRPGAQRLEFLDLAEVENLRMGWALNARKDRRRDDGNHERL
jgi:hypothetical protein